jgi:hypothetical protein
MTINGKPVFINDILIRPNIIVKFQGETITYQDSSASHFDRFVQSIHDEQNTEDLQDVKGSYRKRLCALIITYFAKHPFEKVSYQDNELFDTIILHLESYYIEYFKDVRVPKRKELVETLVGHRTETIKELFNLTNNLLNGFFSKSLFKFLQEYTKVVNQPGYQCCIAPLLPGSIHLRSVIESLIKPIYEAQTKLDIDEKFILFEHYKEMYLLYSNLLDPTDEIDNLIYRQIGNYLFSLFKSECKTLESKPAIISIASTKRRYNFENFEREKFNLFFLIENTGEGIARDIRVEPVSKNFLFERYSVGVLIPGESREFSVESQVSKDNLDRCLTLSCSWLEGTSTEKHCVFTIKFFLQNTEIPWSELERRKPYTIQEIEQKDKLYGRDEILKELEQNILSDKIESYKLWGQKRVGKSSIVKTLKTAFHSQNNVIVVWRSIAGLKNTDPILTLNTLGESLCSEIFEEIDVKVSSDTVKAKLRSLQVPEFNGSLFPLENYIKQLRRIESQLRFVFILDEFDRINEEFFLPGTIGDSFSLNVGKGLSTIKYVGFILVGSENMHLLDRQEINYNSFQEREIDTFDKKTEYDSFRKIVIGPIMPYVTYTDDAIERIFYTTNGNPYFANLICSNIFKICLKLKDNEVDIVTTDMAISKIVESSQKSHFEHFWGDGITEESNVKKERKADIRRRILVSYSLAHFDSSTHPSKDQIIKGFKKPVEYGIESYEIENTITEFFNRKIFFQANSGRIRIRPILFEKWLCGPGRTLMIEGVADLEALQREKQLEAQHALKKEELQRITENLVFQGETLREDILLSYFNQFGGPFEQRRIFGLIDSILYISKLDIRDFIQREKKSFFKKGELALKDGVKTPHRENVEVYSFSRTVKENEKIFETFKRLTLIRSTKSLKNLLSNKDAWKNTNSDDIIIFESVIDSFFDISSELIGLFDEKIVVEKIPVKLIVFVITTKAKADLVKAMSQYDNFRLIHYKEVEEGKIKPFIDTTEVFESKDEASYAFAEVKKHFHSTSKESFNVLFESHCPCKSVPIYWHSTPQYRAIFPNEYGTFYQEAKDYHGESYRDRVYNSTRDFIQVINPFLLQNLRDKAVADGHSGDDNWFRTSYIPQGTITSITKRWAEENCTFPRESYFDLIDYLEIVKKNKDLLPLFEIRDKRSGGSGLEWFTKINEIRRTAAHHEKPPPSLADTLYFEEKTKTVLDRILTK